MINTEIYRDKVRACWLGKCLGGNLGMPYEGCEGPLELKHDAVQRVSVPNDDLELQTLWLWLIENRGESLRSGDFVPVWDKWYQADCDEYGVARWNIRRGLKPPATGLHNNWFTDGMGAAIRSEIWACLFPGKPVLASVFAREDACVDHAGEGIFAEIFLAAAESSAFISGDFSVAVNAGLDLIPTDSRVAQVVRFVGELWQRHLPVTQARAQILSKFGSHNFTDACMNLGFIMLGLWYGEQQFEKSVLTAVNCGMDTDCTAATTAAMMGILLGSDGLPESWRDSVDNSLTYSVFLKGLPLPKTVDEFVERVVAMERRLSGLLPEQSLANITPAMTRDPVDDGHQWLIFRSPLGGDFLTEPKEISKAGINRSGRFRENIAEFACINMDLSPYIEKAGDTLNLFTWLKMDRNIKARLMVCADMTGITVWLDEQMIMNYHGRRKSVPAFHRVEGGAVVPVDLRADHPRLLRIRLLFCHKPLPITVALADSQNCYLDGMRFYVEK